MDCIGALGLICSFVRDTFCLGVRVVLGGGLELRAGPEGRVARV